jgi:hypothetical protein
MGVTSEGLSYVETQMKDYRHLASLGSPYHVAAVRGWSDAESKAMESPTRNGGGLIRSRR